MKWGAPKLTAEEPLLVAEHVTVRFGGVTALSDVGLVVGNREVVGLIGPNGAGKTTLFNCLAGTLHATEGTVHFGNTSIDGFSTHQRARIGIGRTFQRIQLFAGMTVREHLVVAERAHRGNGGLWKDVLGIRTARAEEDAHVREMLDLLDLTHDANRPIEAMSLGRGRLVEVARALMTEPRLLLLDEPSSGLDHDETSALTETLRAVHQERGTAMLLVEHNIEMVRALVERIYVLDSGTMIAKGAAEDVMRDANVREAYLGQTSTTTEPMNPPRRRV